MECLKEGADAKTGAMKQKAGLARYRRAGDFFYTMRIQVI